MKCSGIVEVSVAWIKAASLPPPLLCLPGPPYNRHSHRSVFVVVVVVPAMKADGEIRSLCTEKSWNEFHTQQVVGRLVDFSTGFFSSQENMNLFQPS